MNPEYADIELIERYFEGTLTANELLDFEKRVQDDSDFAQQVKAQKISTMLLEEYEFLQLKKQMKQEMPSPSSGGNSHNYLLYAGATLIMGIGTYFLVTNPGKKETSPSETIVENKKEETIVPEHKQQNSTSLSENNTNTKNNLNSGLNSTDTVSFNSKKSEIKNENTALESTTKSIDTNPNATITTEKKQEHTQPDCSGLLIENTIEKENTCEGKNSGSIKITILKGGTPPYLYQLSNKRNFTSSAKFNYLPAGEYSLTIKESSGCVFHVKELIKIETIVCYKPFNETFSPSQESTWKLPIEAGQSGKIKFHNKAGLVVHEIVVQNGYPSEWDGVNYKGEETAPGYYYVTIEKSDGTLEYGYLTINR